MALLGRALGLAVVVGAGVAIVATVVAAPGVLRAARPLAREALRRGLDAVERARSAAAELVEDVDDLVAEVRAERQTDKAPSRDPAS